MSASTLTEPALLRLLQLASASLPVGGFAYSQGLEYAVEDGWLVDGDGVADWLHLQLCHSLARTDLAMVPRLYRAFDAGNAPPKGRGGEGRVEARIAQANAWLLACRETRELRLTDNAMGRALVSLMPGIGLAPPPGISGDCSFITAFSWAAWRWLLPERACALAIAWSWLENQVAAATKLVPLGQTRAQQLLGEIQVEVPAAIDCAFALDDTELGGSLPGLAMASALHETQYSRLFRS